MAQFVEALRYKPEGRRFDSRWCHWNFSLTYSFRSHYGPGVDSASNRNLYQEYFLGRKSGRWVGLTTLPPSCADCLDIWEPQTPETSGPVQACNGIALPVFNFTKILLKILIFLNVWFWFMKVGGTEQKERIVCILREVRFTTIFFLALQPPLGVVFYSPLVGFSLLACEVSWSHTTTRHIR